MSGISKLAAWAVLSLSIVGNAAQAASVSLSHYETLQRLNVQGTGMDGNQKIAVTGPVDLEFDALGRSFDVQLSPNANLLDAARDITSATVIPYRGRLAGNENSWVRIVMSDRPR
jgi:hypothetical protein